MNIILDPLQLSVQYIDVNIRNSRIGTIKVHFIFEKIVYFAIEKFVNSLGRKCFKTTNAILMHA